jgi:hypothetical protein
MMNIYPQNCARFRQGIERGYTEVKMAWVSGWRVVGSKSNKKKLENMSERCLDLNLMIHLTPSHFMLHEHVALMGSITQ